jgi:serine/threonine protein kinase
MAPEQTGRMNRSIDGRSDLYSLGVTFYQMLTNALPFAAANPSEWVHCHIALQPTSPSQRAAVPEPLSAITMKLLAKNAEERYQTAYGLETDLRRCLAEWKSHGRIDPFPLGAHDSTERLLIPEKLYGREHETLTAATSPAQLFALQQMVPTSQLLMGFDNPFVPAWTLPPAIHDIQRWNGFSDKDVASLARRNAEWLYPALAVRMQRSKAA